jgi:hypothetical protein
MRSISSPAHQAEIIKDGCARLSKKVLNQLNDDAVETICFGLIAFALANFDKMQALFDAQINYCADEDLHPHEYWCAQIAAKAKRRRK